MQDVQNLVPYKIVDGQDGAAWVQVQGNKMSPSQVSETAIMPWPVILLSSCFLERKMATCC